VKDHGDVGSRLRPPSMDAAGALAKQQDELTMRDARLESR
jgi:hypothetical protein